MATCLVVPQTLCGYRQGEPSPYFVSRLLRRAQLSYYRASHGHEQGPDPRWYPSVLPFRYNPCAGTVESPDSLPSRTPVGSGPYQQVQPGGVTLDGALEMVRQSHQWKELKRIILVSPRGAETLVERTKEEYPRITPVELRYRADDESEIRAQTLVSETRSDSAEFHRCRFPWAYALCRTYSSCIYIVSAITPRVITARYLILLTNKVQGSLLYIIFIIGCIGYRKGTTSGDNDRLCIGIGK